MFLFYYFGVKIYAFGYVDLISVECFEIWLAAVGLLGTPMKKNLQFNPTPGGSEIYVGFGGGGVGKFTYAYYVRF